MKQRNLGDLAAELEGVSAMVTTLAITVRHAQTGVECPSEGIIDSAFFSVSSALDRISEDLNTLEIEQLRSLRT